MYTERLRTNHHKQASLWHGSWMPLPVRANSKNTGLSETNLPLSVIRIGQMGKYKEAKGPFHYSTSGSMSVFQLSMRLIPS